MINSYGFEKVKKNFGFGCMRLPMKGDEVDTKEFCLMIDTFLANGFNYFDTAHMYVSGKSETALRECLVKRHPREEFVLVNKLSNPYFKKEEEILPFFEMQLEACGTDYFDFYLMHAQDKKIYEKYKKCHAYEIAQELKKQGKIKHLGISFHDTADVLDEILTDHPEIEVVQIQFNYIDYDDPSIQSKACYDVCRKHKKPIIIMEPVKGGALVNLPEDAKKALSDLNGGSAASYAIRFAASFEGVMMVLSGMGNTEMMNDNIGYMKDFIPLTATEHKAIENVRTILKGQNLIPCTACEYCIPECPKNIAIPAIFSCLNSKNKGEDWSSGFYYEINTQKGSKASDCIECGKCEAACPQHLPIRKLLKDAVSAFETKEDK